MTTTTLGALPSSLIALSSAVWAPIGKVRIARRPTELGDPHERVGRQAPQELRQRALTDRDEYVAQVNGLVAEPLADRLELLAEDLGHPRQDVHVPHQDRREPHRLTPDQLGALG